MLIRNEVIFSLIADLWNAVARVKGEREQGWCAESVRAEVKASGEQPDKALGEAVKEIVNTVDKLNLYSLLEETDYENYDDEKYDADDEEYDEEYETDGDDADDEEC